MKQWLGSLVFRLCYIFGDEYICLLTLFGTYSASHFIHNNLFDPETAHSSPLKKPSEPIDVARCMFLCNIYLLIISLRLFTSLLLDVHYILSHYSAILFLASEVASGNITGHVLDINAGMEGRLLNRREDFS